MSSVVLEDLRASQIQAGKSNAMSRDAASVVPWGFLELFLILQTALPALLMFSQFQSLRTVVRIAPYGLSLCGLALLPVASQRPACWKWLAAGWAYLLLMILHPQTNTLTSGVAQAALYLSVFCPVLWCPQQVQSVVRLRRIILILVLCNGINSAVGVMQVKDPDRWMPAEFSEVVTNSTYGLASVSYTGPDGRLIVRPPGLFDTPGAVSGPATTASILGIALLVMPTKFWEKLIGLSAMSSGLTVILLTQVRTALVLVGLGVLVFTVLLFLQRRWLQATVLVLVLAVAGISSWSSATRLAGESVQDRFSSLMDDGLLATYNSTSRGEMVWYGLNKLLPEFPLGAGLGRWGMMRTYFGDEQNPSSPSIWSEIQINSWILDGGIVLLLCYSAALLVASWQHFRTLARLDDRSQLWSMLVLALNVTCLAMCVSFTPFTTQVGLQYWLLTGAVLGLAANRPSNKALHVQ